MPQTHRPAKPLAVIDVVGLTPSVIGDHTPNLRAYLDSRSSLGLIPPLPAVTTTCQSTMLTGAPPSEHGIVGNGWYDRALCEVMFWKQSNRLVQREKVWDVMRRRDEHATCLNMFWWFNMYSSADFSVTPRPRYKADGRKIPDCYSNPPDLRHHLQEKLGPFPLFKFWGPMASIESTEWIARATMITHAMTSPTLTLVYLPHLDYEFQRSGPESEQSRKEAAELDRVFGMLIDYFQTMDVETMVLSEYGIVPVSRPVHINRALREQGFIEVRHEDGTEIFDAGASRAFAVADHQIAHVYVKDPADLDAISKLLEGLDGVAQVLDASGQSAAGLAHERAGDLTVLAEPDAWFTYYYWLDDAQAPDFARTVDIHRKPGYDPAELFVDPSISNPKLALGLKLAKKKLGFRTLMDMIPLDASLVKGSHGRTDNPAESCPMLIGNGLPARDDGRLAMAAVRDVMLDRLFRE